MVLTDLIATKFREIEIFSLDTGRLPEETYALMRDTADRYGIRIRVYFPQAQAVEQYVSEHGSTRSMTASNWASAAATSASARSEATM